MTIDDMREVIADVNFPEYHFGIVESGHGFIYLQASYDEADTVTGNMDRQYTRRWPLSPAMTKSEIVSTVFKCVLTSMEHKTREHFLYRDRAIYQPHFDVESLWNICEERVQRGVTA